MTWNVFHTRGETLREVVRVADERRDGTLPLDVPGVTEHFVDHTDLVAALLLKWHARLSGNLERALTREPMDLDAAVASAWRRTAEQTPGLRLLLDRSTDDPETPAMATMTNRARQREWARLAMAAGLAGADGAAAAAAGRRIEDRAREGLSLAAPTPADREVVPAPRTTTNESFVQRIKAALAAA